MRFWVGGGGRGGRVAASLVAGPLGPGSRAAGAGPLSPEQIEERLRAQRAALAASVDEFASRADPRTQAREAGEHLREQASAKVDHLREQAAAGADRLREEARRLAEQAEETWERAKQGDSEATSALAKAAAVAGGVVAAGVVLTRLARR